MSTKVDMKLLNERALETALPAAYEVAEEVEVLGEPLAHPVYWTGRQWAVTKYGIEARDGRYQIAGKRVWEQSSDRGWIEHLEEKEWVDLADFAEALRLARARWPKTVV